ncbi:MFS transporter [Actinocrispum wychmicini]|uniref:Putative MFS family arabinose efflux permease n=1 Tax=Actinocrispum wychmicini TaxID=1213861 RepID=A0A4R2JBZ4_9PSEU|nr:MFS transporter [Actinocrispum wychmicini]TCO54248.1 putative MFS family arabinose efflux permease [Actinocrispum wychmicini]
MTVLAFDRRLIAPMILGAVLNPVNSSMIAVALIPIGVAFGAPPAETAWLVSSLYVATAIGQPVVGRLVDMYGPRRLYLAGSALLGVAGILGALAPSLGVLIGARALLGLGTCAGYPAAMFLIRQESHRTGRDSPSGVLTALAVSTQTVAVVGPTLGGLLIGLGGWRTIFVVNVPLAVACLVLGALRLPTQPTRKGSLAVRDLIDLGVLVGNRPLVATYARNLLTFVVSYTFLYGYTQWLEEGHGLTAAQAGAALLPMFLTAIVVSGITGRHKGVRGKLIVGGVGQILGCALLLTVHADSGIWLLVLIGVIVGVPQGLNSLANQNALYYQADPARMGASAGLLRTSTYLGAMVAAAANGAFLSRSASTSGLHDLALFVLVVAALFLVVTVFDRSLRWSRLSHSPA